MAAKHRTRLHGNQRSNWKYVRLHSSSVSFKVVLLLLLWNKNINNCFLRITKNHQPLTFQKPHHNKYDITWVTSPTIPNIRQTEGKEDACKTALTAAFEALGR